MPTLNTTPNRGYQEPAVGNTLEVDVARLIAALRAIDADMAAAFAAIVAKAALASPAFTGTPTAPTAAPGTDTGQLATTAFVRAAIAALVGLAPGALDTIEELAAASENNSDLIDLLETAVALKADAAATLSALALKADAAVISAALAKRLRTDSAQSFTAAEKGQALANIGGSILAGFRDKLINGDGQINQRTYTTVADDVYWCDRHYVLTQTAAITPTILTDVANGLPFMMRLSQSQASAQRMGNAQIAEAAVSKRLRGKQMTLGGKLRCSASQAIRYAVLEWTGTADAPTSDVVASWTNGAFTAGNFFLGSNLTVAAVGTITPAANTLTDWSLTANISGSCNNLIVMMWTEGTAAQNVTLDMAWGLVVGDASTETWPYDVRSPQQEIALCQRHFVRYPNSLRIRAAGYSANARVFGQTWMFPVKMRIAPAMAASNVSYGGTNSLTFEDATADSFGAYAVAATDGSNTATFQYTADAEL